MKKIVITGATGVIGRALINKLVNEKKEVLAICRKGSKGILTLPKSEYLTIIEYNLNEYNQIRLEETYDVFYHFAWDGTLKEERNDMYLQNLNVQYTLDAVNLANSLGCKTFIGAGSQAEYGRVNDKISSDTPVRPENGYGIAKLCAGQMSKILCENLNMQHIWVRILSVYGPYDDENTMVKSLINKLINNKTPKLTEAKQVWDYLYSDDAAEAFYLLGEARDLHGKIYCLGGGVGRPLYEYIYEIRDQIDKNLSIDLGSIPYSENQVMYLCANIDELKKDVGFEPKITFKQGIELLLKNDFGGCQNE